MHSILIPGDLAISAFKRKDSFYLRDTQTNIGDRNTFMKSESEPIRGGRFEVDLHRRQNLIQTEKALAVKGQYFLIADWRRGRVGLPVQQKLFP